MLQTSSQSSLSLVLPDPTQVEFIILKLGLSRVCLTALKQNYVKFDFSKAARQQNPVVHKILDVSPEVTLYDRALKVYEMLRALVLGG